MPHKLLYRGFLFAVLLALVLSAVILPRAAAAQGELPSGYFREVRWIEMAEIGLPAPTGLAYSASDQALLVLSARQPDALAQVGLYLEDLTGTVKLSTLVANPISMTFDSQAGRLLVVDPKQQALLGVETRPGQKPGTQGVRALGRSGSSGTLGITSDAQTGRVYAVEGDGGGIAILDPGDAPVRLNIRRGLRGISLRGIAFHPVERRLFAIDPRSKLLYEISEAGELLSARDLSGLGLRDPQAMTFAPSGDPTDDPAALSLYIADSGVDLPGGGVLELSMIGPKLSDIQPMLKTGTLVRTIYLNTWSPSSPDPSGIGPMHKNGTLLVADSEVDEMPPYFTGSNLFESTYSGSLLRTASTTAYSTEPVGAAMNPVNNHVFISDDNRRRIFEINLGADGVLGTADDTRWYMSTAAVGSNDPEGVGFGNGLLFIADGVGSEVYVVSPGPNGRFDGVPPTSDDALVTHFDTSAYGISDPEGIDYNPDTGTLFIAGNSSRSKLLEMTVDGQIVNVIDIAFTRSMAPAGVAVAPNSRNPALRSIYISDRRVDNGADPYENDGQIYEVELATYTGPTWTSTPTRAPTRTPTRTATAAVSATVTATATSTQTATATVNAIPTSTHTATSTPTPTLPDVPTDTPTVTATNISAATETPAPTATVEAPATATATVETPATATATVEAPATATATAAATAIPENLALNRTVTVSSTEPNNNGDAKNAVDGNLNTRWKSKYNGTLPAEWIIVDLGSTQQISRVVLRWNYYATAYTIDVSEDGQAWATVYQTTSGNGDPDEFTFSPVNARYVRMNATAFYRSTYRLYLREFEIYR